MHKPKKFWNVKTSAATPGAVDIYIYGIIGDSWFNEDGSDTTAFAFVPEFKALEAKYDRINIRINSPGGSINDGLPVFNAILQSTKDVHTYNDGIAYSMAAIILQAGKTRHSAKNALTLMHSPMTITMGNAKDHQDAIDFLNSYEGSLIQCLTDKTGLTEDELKAKYFDCQDHILTATQALDDKIIDVIEETPANVPANIKDMTYDQVMQYFSSGNSKDKKSFITDLVDQLKAVFNSKPEITNPTDIIMENLGKFIAALNLAPEATIDEVLKAINDLNTAKKTAEDALQTANTAKTQLTTDLQTSKDTLAAVTKKYNDLKAEDAAGEMTAGKDKDKIPGDKKDPSASFKHNKVADSVAPESK